MSRPRQQRGSDDVATAIAEVAEGPVRGEVMDAEIIEERPDPRTLPVAPWARRRGIDDRVFTLPTEFLECRMRHDWPSMTAPGVIQPMRARDTTIRLVYKCGRCGMTRTEEMGLDGERITTPVYGNIPEGYRMDPGSGYLPIHNVRGGLAARVVGIARQRAIENVQTGEVL